MREREREREEEGEEIEDKKKSVRLERITKATLSFVFSLLLTVPKAHSDTRRKRNCSSGGGGGGMRHANNIAQSI